MKALVRRRFETITQDMGLSFINWNTGAPLTNADWSGGSYVLVNDYVSEDLEGDCTTIDPTPASTQDPVEDGAPDTIVIDGVTYIRTS